MLCNGATPAGRCAALPATTIPTNFSACTELDPARKVYHCSDDETTAQARACPARSTIFIEAAYISVSANAGGTSDPIARQRPAHLLHRPDIATKIWNFYQS